MCVLTMLKNSENTGMEEIGLVTPTPELCNNGSQMYYWKR